MPGIRALIAGPLYHGAPNAFGIRTGRVAELIVSMPRYDSEELLRLIERHRITNVFMVPTMFVRMMKLPADVRAKYDVSSLKRVITAAAPCPPEVKKAMIDWWGPIIDEFYAATEISYMTACNSAESLAKPGTVGRRLPGVTMKALDDDGNEMPAGEPGELYGKLDLCPDFTYHNRDDERQAIEIDGLVSCGDVGYFDEDGYLFLCDRKKDLVISGGVNIYPAEIEAELVGMPGVADCAVFGIPDAEFGEKLMAVVQPDAEGTLEADAVTAFLRGRMAGFKVPRVVEFRAALPRDDSGKIYKRLIRDEYWKQSGQRI